MIALLVIVIILLLLNWFNSSSIGNFKPNVKTTGAPKGEANSDLILYYFYSPQCGHCQKFSPTWNEIAEKLRGNSQISLRAVDATKSENQNLAFYYNITAYPTLILVTPNGNVAYRGNRTSNDLYQFVGKHLN